VAVILEALAGVAALSLVGLFGLKVARWVEETNLPTEATAMAELEPVDPRALRSWRRIGHDDYELTLGNGQAYREDFIDWFCWPSGEEVDYHSELHNTLKGHANRVRRCVPSVMELEVKS
jgi:hypothetical protein